MPISTTDADSRAAPTGPIPPLENGDRLTLREFLRRYEAMPDIHKAELIEGIVSTVFPGLWLDAPALVANDMRRVLTVPQEGLASPEHAAFVEELARRQVP